MQTINTQHDLAQEKVGSYHKEAIVWKLSEHKSARVHLVNVLHYFVKKLKPDTSEVSVKQLERMI